MRLDRQGLNRRQRQICIKDRLKLFNDLQEQFSFTLLFVSHDLAVIRQMCDRVIVMKDGEALENDSNDNIFEQPKHAYTRSLLDSMPKFQGLAQY